MNLQVAERKWFCMSAAQKEAHIRKVSRSRVAAVSMPTGSAVALQGQKLSVDAASASKGTCVPQATIEAIWVKAEEYLNTPGDITGAPGCSPHSRMVKSRSGSRPHLVKQDKGSFVCDDMCGHWKGLGICSHSVVVAELNGCLLDFVTTFQRKKKVPNFTELALSSVPKGRGRKGAKPPRKRSKPQPIEERVPLTVAPSGSSVSHSEVQVLSSAPLPPTVVQNVCVGHHMSQGISSPTLTSQGISSPILTSQCISSPILTSQGISSPILTSQGISSPILTSQGISSPILTSQGISSPILTSQGIIFSHPHISGHIFFYSSCTCASVWHTWPTWPTWPTLESANAITTTSSTECIHIANCTWKYQCLCRMSWTFYQGCCLSLQSLCKTHGMEAIYTPWG